MPHIASPAAIPGFQPRFPALKSSKSVSKEGLGAICLPRFPAYHLYPENYTYKTPRCQSDIMMTAVKFLQRHQAG
jgi:hypothetical protein